MKCTMLHRVLLATLLLLLMHSSAYGADAEVIPTPPAWCPAEEYVTFEGSVIYQSENWEKVLALREHFGAGLTMEDAGWEPTLSQYYQDIEELRDAPRGDLGLHFELGLLHIKHFSNLESWPEDKKDSPETGQSDFVYARNHTDAPHQKYICSLWQARALTVYGSKGLFMSSLPILLTNEDFTWARFFDTDLFRQSDPNHAITAWLRDGVFLMLDKGMVYPDYYSAESAECEVVNGRTMVPIRYLAERLGAVVTWDNDTQQITMVRADVTTVMAIGSEQATVNGQIIQMDAAPCLSSKNRTLIPVRYMAEFFGQLVTWDPEKQLVHITENRAAIGNSNLEAWALPMGAMLHQINTNYGYDPLYFARISRAPVGGYSALAFDYVGDARKTLRSGWGVGDREELLSTVLSMTFGGHNASFLQAVYDLSSMTDAQYEALLAKAGAVDSYMWTYTAQLNEKWGGRGILAWDMFRMSNVVQWGYEAGYITFPEALVLLEPAAQRLHDSFSSWEEAYENYLDGYHWWARVNVLDTDIWQTERGLAYQEMMASETAAIFDDTLFSTDVIPVPELSYLDVLT